jgi:hypothetical protein
MELCHIRLAAFIITYSVETILRKLTALGGWRLQLHGSVSSLRKE